MIKKFITILFIITMGLLTTVCAEQTAPAAGTITLTQFLGVDAENTQEITLSYLGMKIPVNPTDFYAIADDMILTSQPDMRQIEMGGMFITAEKKDGTFEYAYINENGEADKYSPLMSRLPYAMYVADQADTVGRLFSFVPMRSDWAKEDLEKAQNQGIIPEDFGVTNYTQTITREKFCDLAFAMLHKKSGLQWSTTSDVPFQDTGNQSIGTLYHHGIIKGKSAGIFAPNDFITREEAATILMRIAGFLKYDLPTVGNVVSYYDEGNISDWAKEAVLQIHELGIMNGNKYYFYPSEGYTIEQAIVTMLRLYDLLSDYEEAAAVVRQYFEAYAKADYETMKQYSTAGHIEQCFHDGDVWGNKWAKLISMEPVNESVAEGQYVFNVSVEMETVPTSSQYPTTQGGFYVILKQENGTWKIEEYVTGL